MSKLNDFDIRQKAGWQKNSCYVPVEIDINRLLSYSFEDVIQLRRAGNVGLTVIAGGIAYNLFPKDIHISIEETVVRAEFECTGYGKDRLIISKEFREF